MNAIVWGGLAVSIVLTLVGGATRSWPALGIAALLSGVASTLATFSIGTFTFLLTSLQLAFALGLRLPEIGRDWPRPAGLGLAVWAVAAALQFLSAFAFQDQPWAWFTVFPLVLALGTLALFAGPRFVRRRSGGPNGAAPGDAPV